MAEDTANLKREIERVERRFYYDMYDCFCAEEMRNTHEPDCNYGEAKNRLAKLRDRLKER